MLKKNYKHAMLLFVLVIAAMNFVGCTTEVPPGYVGMVLEPAGLTGVALEPGRHSCWGRDQMILVETLEPTHTEHLSVLCADDLNFKFDLKIRSRLKARDGEGLKEVLNKQGAKMENYQLAYEVLYQTYVSPAARSIARTLVSKYQTTQIRENREEIQKTILEKLIASTKGTPVEVVMAVTSNFDYPEVITAAVEKRRKKEIEIDEEKAKQAMELLKADNRLKVAQKMKTVRTAEAEAEAVYFRILGKALTSNYLSLREIEAKVSLYQNVGKGDKVIVTQPGTPVMPMIGTGKNP